MAKEVAAEGDRGKHFTPPLSDDELAFFDAVSTNESAVVLQGKDVLAQIARELVEVMRRDVKTDWMVRDDVRAKLRSSIKRLLVKHKYPPDKQPDAIKVGYRADGGHSTAVHDMTASLVPASDTRANSGRRPLQLSPRASG